MTTDFTPSQEHPAIENEADKGERLQNVLSHRGIASRRHAAEMIEEGRVTVNGTRVSEPGFRVMIGRDKISVDGRPLSVQEEEHHTVLLFKPRGLICGADNSQGETVCDLMRREYAERLVPVGRLDKETEGLLLLSNDGELIQRMTHPRYGHSKTYYAKVAGHMTDEKIALLRSRMEIDGYLIRPVEVDVLKVGADNVHKLSFTLTEGRNRQIRKMCATAGFTVLKLTRVRIGPLKIRTMEPGDWRELSDEEVRQLKRPVKPGREEGRPPRSAPARGGRPDRRERESRSPRPYRRGR